MTGAVILDASAVLAWLQGEPGADMIEELLEATNPPLVTAANHCEIIAKLLDKGSQPEDLKGILSAIGYAVIATTAEDGDAAGWLRRESRALGLSLGDRLCLAAAQRLNAQVFTADRVWLQLPPALGIDVRCIRPET